MSVRDERMIDGPRDTDELVRARVYLMRVAEPPAPALRSFIDKHGPVDAAAMVAAGSVPDAVASETAARKHLDLVTDDLARAAGAGAGLLIPEDEHWPRWSFAALDLAAERGCRHVGQPLGLWVRGRRSLADMAERAVSVVGSRAATGYGEQLATEFGYGLSQAGFCVVSGAAYGIDGAAHRGSLAANGPTVAVLACGIDVAYPAGHARLLDDIADKGAVISEYAPGTPPARHRFLVRNRLIAALSAGTVVVEAGRRSGARNTAATAAALGRVVMATPGPVTSAMSVGCHELLRLGDAELVSSVAEVIEMCGRIGDDLAEPADEQPRHVDGLGEEAKRVYEALDLRAGRSAEAVSVDSGVPLDRVRALLPELEINGLAIRCEFGWQRFAGERRGDA